MWNSQILLQNWTMFKNSILQVFLAYFSPGPGCFPGHLEKYDVMGPPPSPEQHEADAEEMEESLEVEASSDREAFFARLNLLTNEGGKRIAEVLSISRSMLTFSSTWFVGLQEKEA